MIKRHSLKLNKPETRIASDCLIQLEQLGVLDKKSKKRITGAIKNAYATHIGNNALNHIHGFLRGLLD